MTSVLVIAGPLESPTGEGMTDLADVGFASPFDVAFRSSPFEHLAQLRRERPVYSVPGTPLVLVTSYADCAEVLTTPAVFRNSRAGFEDAFEAIGFAPRDPAVRALLDEAPPMLVHTDPPTHTAHRRLISSWFSPRQVETRWAPLIAGHVGGLLDDFAPDGTVEFMDQLAAPLPNLVMCDILGLSSERWRDFKRWSDDSVAPLGRQLDRAAWEAHARSAAEMGSFLLEVVRSRRGVQGSDLISALAGHLDAEDDVDRLTEEQIVSLLGQLLAAGNETTTQLLGSAMVLFAQRPDVWGRLRAEPALVPSAVEEALRLVSPVRGLFKTVHRDAELHGTPIPAISVIGLMFGSANHDDAVFDDPTAFRLERDNVGQHLALGRGIHFCIGAPLARAEARIALEGLLTRFPTVRMQDGAALREGTPSFMLGNLVELPLSFSTIESVAR